MGSSPNLSRNIRSDADLARMIVRMAEAVQADVILCVTESGMLARHLHGSSNQWRIIAATTNSETYDTLTQRGLEVMRLPLRAADKYHQVRHVISVAYRANKLTSGDLVVCTTGRDLYPEEGNLVILTDVEPSVANLAVSDLLRLTDGIQPRTLEAAIAVACKIGRSAQRGKLIGSIFMLGDSIHVLERSRQLIPNPFHGHDETLRRLTNPDIHDALVELSKLDGAFVVRGDGFIQTAGVFLASGQVDVDMPAGFGARHLSAATTTKRTAATAVVVSATDGHVRVFSGGQMVLQIDPVVADGLVITDE